MCAYFLYIVIQQLAMPASGNIIFHKIDSHTRTGTNRHTTINSLSSTSVTTEAKSNKRPRVADKSGKQPSKKKPRQSNEALLVVRINNIILIVFHTCCYPGLSPIKFSLIDAPTKRGRDLQIKTNMLQSMTLCNNVVIDECTVGLWL